MDTAILPVDPSAIAPSRGPGRAGRPALPADPASDGDGSFATLLGDTASSAAGELRDGPAPAEKSPRAASSGKGEKPNASAEAKRAKKDSGGEAVSVESTSFPVCLTGSAAISAGASDVVPGTEAGSAPPIEVPFPQGEPSAAPVREGSAAASPSAEQGVVSPAPGGSAPPVIRANGGTDAGSARPVEAPSPQTEPSASPSREISAAASPSAEDSAASPAQGGGAPTVPRAEGGTDAGSARPAEVPSPRGKASVASVERADPAGSASRGDVSSAVPEGASGSAVPASDAPESIEDTAASRKKEGVGASVKERIDSDAAAASAPEGQPAEKAAPVRNAPLSPSPRTVRFEENAFVITRKSDTSVDVTLSPPGVGKLTIEIALEKGVVNARITAADPAGREAIERNLPNIVETLARDGMNIGGFTVSLRERRNGAGDTQGAAGPPDEDARPRIAAPPVAPGASSGRIDILV